MATTKKTTKNTEDEKSEEKKVAPKKAAAPKAEKKESAAVKAGADEKVEATDDGKKDEYLYAVGRRKTATAQVRVYKKGDGTVQVNFKDLKDVFPTSFDQWTITSPLKLIGQQDKLNVTARVVGGGTNGQAEAIRHGIARALIMLNPNFRKPLKKAGFLKRDDRKKERKKPGLKGARRAPQWKKR